MKKISILFFALFLFSGAGIAQNAATPNPDFELWTHTGGTIPYDDPNSWNSLNPTTAVIPFVGDVTCYQATAVGSFHLGAAAVKLVTKSIVGNNANGIITTGTINTSTQAITGGINFTARPDSIVGWYKSTLGSTDSAFAQLILTGTGGDTDTIGYGIFRTPSASQATYIRFAAKITYNNANTPVKSQWLLSSSAGATGQIVGSTVWFDDLDLTTATATTVSNEITTGISVGPNPSQGLLKVVNKNATASTLTIYDAVGRTYGSYKLAGNETAIDISSFNSGSYIYSVISENGDHLLSSGLLIRK